MLDYFFKKVDVHLCPAVNGRITEDGKPIEGLKIVRQLAYNDFDPIKDEAYSDANGNFTFPEKNIRLPKRKISWQHNSTMQAIVIEDKAKRYRKWDGDEYYRLWQVSMDGTKPISSFKEKLIQLNCDLNDKEVYFMFQPAPYMADEPRLKFQGRTICRWDNDFLIRKYY